MSRIPRSARSLPRRLGVLLGATAVAVALLVTPAAASSGGGLATTPLYGGTIMTNGSDRCVTSFNATSNGSYYVITAGECTNGGGSWYVDGRYLGTTVASNFPGGGYGLVEVTGAGWQPQPAIRSAAGPVPITGYGQPSVGSQVCVTDEESPVSCGTVWAMNATVRTPEGVVYGLVEVNLPGCPLLEAGAPVFTGDTAVGLVVVTSNNCSSGTTYYYAPVGEVMSAYGLSLV